MRKSIQVFAETAMERKLQRYDALKGSWEGTPTEHLFHRLQQEVTELQEAMEYYRDHPMVDFRQSVMAECADVANFAMMIYSQLHPETSGLSRGRKPEPSAFVHGGDAMPSDRVIMKGGLR